MEELIREKKILKVILILVVLLVLFLILKVIFVKVVNKNLRNYLSKQGYTAEVEDKYTLVNGMTFNEYETSTSPLKSSEIYSYDIKNFLYSYDKRNMDSEKQTTINALYKINKSRLTAYYSEENYNTNESIYVNFVYDLISDSYDCVVTLGNQSIKEEKCNMLKEIADTTKSKYKEIIKKSGAVEGIIK